MAKQYGIPYPERHRMAVLSDLLNVPHFTTSNGSTVRRDFLEAVARALGHPDPRAVPTKDEVLAECLRRASLGTLDPKAYFSPGGTVTDRALQAMIDGIVVHGLAGPPAAPSITPSPAPADAPASPGQPGPPTGADALALPMTQLEDLLDPAHGLPGSARRLMAIAYRESQDAFRRDVLTAYGEKCAVTAHGPSQALEAAHIVPHGEGGLPVVSNGLALRADVHRLFDRGLLAVDETTLRVLVHPVLVPTEYGAVAGRRILLPKALPDRPAAAALRHRREACGL